MKLSKRLHPGMFRLKHFKRIFPDGMDLVPSEFDMNDLLGDEHRPRLLLDAYDEKEVMRGLEYYGVLAKFEEEGFSDIKVRMDLSDPQQQKVILHLGEHKKEHVLGQIYLHSGMFYSESKYAGKLSGRHCPMLSIQWICMQNPTKPFDNSRPALPGQQYPGLKVGRAVAKLLIYIAEERKLAGILNLPEFLHAAVLYSWRFKFLNPEAEGILQALMRDMKQKTLAEGSWGIQLGCIKHLDSGEALSWFKEEQVLPLRHDWVSHFEGKHYKRKVRESRDRHRFYFDEDLWREKYPLDEEGSPKLCYS